MAHALQIDTLAFAKKLKAAGADDRLADAIVEGITAADTSELATKSDIQDVRSEIKEVENVLRTEIKETENVLRGEIGEVRGEVREVKVELRWIKGIGSAILLLNAYPILAKLLS
jgi:TnpA family transposase